MATLHVPKRVCDRCNATVTDKGGRFCFTATGPDTIVAEGEPPKDEYWSGYRACSEEHACDLCRTCAASLQSWWARSAAKREEPAA